VTSRDRRLALQLEAEQAGTLLGAIAWVLGALQIMKDRGHAEGDEEFHELYDELHPRLEALIAKVSGARLGLGADDAMQEEIEAAYAPLRAAFETWIQQTASDTFSVAVGQRLGDVLEDAEEAEGTEGAEASE
jgi:DNA-directed RNA polymerase specialized sigma24 family protein